MLNKTSRQWIWVSVNLHRYYKHPSIYLSLYEYFKIDKIERFKSSSSVENINNFYELFNSSTREEYLGNIKKKKKIIPSNDTIY